MPAVESHHLVPEAVSLIVRGLQDRPFNPIKAHVAYWEESHQHDRAADAVTSAMMRQSGVFGEY
jgi:hypothetical protein